MKRIRRLFALTAILCFLTGCASSKYYTQPEKASYNYNNCTAYDGSFWIAEDAMFLESGFAVVGNYYRITESNVTQLFPALSRSYTRFVVCESSVYVIDDSPREGNFYLIRAYDLDTNEKKVIGNFEDVIVFFVFQNKLFYTQSHFGEIEDTVSLQMYDLETKQETCLHENILCAGVMNDRVVFVLQEDSNYYIYSYDEGEVAQLGSFVCELGDDMITPYDSNFTSDKIVLSCGDKLVCYDITTNQHQIFEFDEYLSSVIAYENYAFAVINKYSSNEENPCKLCRIRLSDGYIESITELYSESHLDIYVDSDDYVYAQILPSGQIYRYTVDGERTLVYKNGIF